MSLHILVVHRQTQIIASFTNRDITTCQGNHHIVPLGHPNPKEIPQLLAYCMN